MVTAVLEYLCSPGSVHAFSLLRTRRLGAVRKVFVVLPWALQPEHFGWKETKPTKPRNGGDSRWRLQLVIQEINSAVLASPDLIAKLWQLLWHSLFVLREAYARTEWSMTYSQSGTKIDHWGEHVFQFFNLPSVLHTKNAWFEQSNQTILY